MEKNEGKVREFKPKEQVRTMPTPEEIAEQERKDEEEMNARLAKFAHMMPKNADSSSIADEEEEDFTISFNQEGKMIATQKIDEGTIVRDSESGVLSVASPDVSQFVSDALFRTGSPQGEAITLKAEPGHEYGGFIRDIFVRKAIAKLIRETREERDKLMAQAELSPGYLGEAIVKAGEEVDKRRAELAKVIRGNEVHYEDLPEWAEPFIREYLERTLTNLILFAEE